MRDSNYLGEGGILARCNGVRKTGPNRWIGKWRDEKTPSLSIRITDDGKILLYDFGGFEFSEICEGLGIHPIQLIPESLRNNRTYSPAERQGHDAQAALNGIYGAAIVTRICAHKMFDGLALDPPDHHALRKASHDIDNAYKAVRGGRHD
ncbi:MAG: hypothetical protein PF483_01640 [Halothiobacillus sp.]|jgi:hypothetical protein|nr:hypothetical protein [Halothiobacillus sp.]